MLCPRKEALHQRMDTTEELEIKCKQPNTCLVALFRHQSRSKKQARKFHSAKNFRHFLETSCHFFSSLTPLM